MRYPVTKILRKGNLFIKKLPTWAKLTLKGYELMIKGWDISEGIFNLAKTKPNLHFLLEKIHKEQ